MRVSFLPAADDRVMVYVKGYTFKDGRSYRIARNIGEAVVWRRDIQRGATQLYPHPTVAP